jgi:hypothetical protein
MTIEQKRGCKDCRLDWYEATIEADLGSLMEALSEAGGEAGSWRSGERRPPHGYGGEQRLEDEYGVVARVWYGGRQEHPHLLASGERTPAVAAILRRDFGDHRVTRVDSCIDFEGAETFDKLQSVMLGVAERSRVSIDTRGDHLLTKQGRTTYLGGTQSAVRARLYDKAAELRQGLRNDPVRQAEVPDHLTRFEAQIRPKGRVAREKFARVSASDCMGSANWLREVWAGITGEKCDPVQAWQGWRRSDEERAINGLLMQYGRVLRQMAKGCGWAGVGEELGRRDDSRRFKTGRASHTAAG